MDESVRLRQATAADFDATVDLLGYVFHHDYDDEARTLERTIWEPERSIVADDAGAIVGHTLALTRDLTVPGAVVPAAHVTGVGVAPSHRRRGLLRAMMHRQLTETAEAGREPIAVLWASETTIYPRFGYGPSAGSMSLSAMTRELRIRPDAPGADLRLRLVDPKKAQDELAAIYDTVRAGRVGWSSRPRGWWDFLLADLKDNRGGATMRHGVICDGPDGRPAGYATWRVKGKWDEYGPDAQVRVTEVAADDPAVYAALWRFLFGIDLARSLEYDTAAVDEPLYLLVDEPRRLGRKYEEALWVRVLDLPSALEARRYLTPVDVVLEVSDPLLPANEGRWRLTGGRDKAACVRTDEPADLALSITDLGALYLGGTSLGSLIAAGRVKPLTGNIPEAAFGWHRLPNPIEVF
ncbi:GNAT family N-acetyltransferase [Paractinoplanes globisporus]|uniref:GNAT family N-acetyltransferase n=1 Tax=Paractinoplanes globisporus TaxID=113565 RepID=A0ABW6WCW7_9ACTN|nr:GNAT family N-acetyltransferase [Actinoplanes globisporus]